MTDDQINQRIAEACGWTQIQSCTCWDDVLRGKAPNENRLKHIEDYCEDLNAMHEAEKALTPQQTDKYVTTLCLEVQPIPSLHNATARQRAEAFLRTLGKWEDGK
jgi:hypothetical protein